MTAFATAAVAAAWVVGMAYGSFLTLRHSEETAADLDPRLSALSRFWSDHGAVLPVPTGRTAVSAARTLGVAARRVADDPRAATGAWLPFVGVTLWTMPGWVAVGVVVLAAPPWLAHVRVLTERRGSA